MAKFPETRLRQQEQYQVAQRRMAELQKENNSRIPSLRREPSKIVISVSDPEAALGLDKHKVFRPLYNIQYARDMDSSLILGYDVFAQSSDAGTYEPMLDRVAQFTGRELERTAADAGYARVRRSEHEELIEAHKERMETPEAKTFYRRRKQTVELAFADTKQHRELRTLSGFGSAVARVQTELTVLVHNLLGVLTALRPSASDANGIPSGP